METNELLKRTIETGSSDLHILVGYPPYLRINGELKPLGEKNITGEESRDLILGLLNNQQKDLYLANKELDFSLDYENKARFRINAYFEKGEMAAALRLLPHRIRRIKELNLPDICLELSSLKSGFILVTGPTGHGKSTTLAAIVEEINQKRSEHIVTIEDPIEYVYQGKKSIISQREMNQDTHSWEVALRSVLREDPDVVLVGEMRDYETIAAALTVAETGHLVLATLHTNSASQTLDRIVDVFPEEKQEQVRLQLSSTIQGIISQRLIPATNVGRVPATEIILGTSAVRTNIREGKTHLIDNIIQTSEAVGMMSLERSLSNWVNQGIITYETARKWAMHRDHLDRFLEKK